MIPRNDLRQDRSCKFAKGKKLMPSGLVDNATKITDLPGELLKEIVKGVSDRDLRSLQRACKTLATWAKDEKDARAKKFVAAVDAFIEKARAAEDARKKAQEDEDDVSD